MNLLGFYDLHFHATLPIQVYQKMILSFPTVTSLIEAPKTYSKPATSIQPKNIPLIAPKT
jgi:hypothetical protein